MKKINDDGWKTSCAICLITTLSYAYYTEFTLLALLCLTVGMLYEQTIEWLAHCFLQHGRSRLLRFFKARHLRHHRDTDNHHALQPLIILYQQLLFCCPHFY